MKTLRFLLSLSFLALSCIFWSCQDEDIVSNVAEAELEAEPTYFVKLVDENGNVVDETKWSYTQTGSVSGTGTYKHNDNVTVRCQGYNIYYQTTSNSSSTAPSATGWLTGGTSTFNIGGITTNYWVKAEKTVTVTATGKANPTAGGSVSIVDNNNGTWTCTYSKNSGYDFVNWTTTGGSLSSTTNNGVKLTASSDCTVTANFKAAAVSTGTLVVSVLNYYGSDSYLQKIQYKLDGTTYNVTGRWEEPDEFLNKSLSAGSHTLSVVDAGTTVNGARDYRVYFDPATFTINAGQTTYVNLIITTN